MSSYLAMQAAEAAYKNSKSVMEKLDKLMEIAIDNQNRLKKIEKDIAEIEQWVDN